jgi:hypothetical protein
MPVIGIARQPAQKAVSARLPVRAGVNQSEKRAPSARVCPGVARTRRSWGGAMPSPIGQATRDVSGGATAAGLEPDRFFFTTAWPQCNRSRQGQPGPHRAGTAECNTATQRCRPPLPVLRLRPRSKDDAAPEPRMPAEPSPANDRRDDDGRRHHDGRRDDDSRTGRHDDGPVGPAAIRGGVEPDPATSGGLGAERCQG